MNNPRGISGSCARSDGHRRRRGRVRITAGEVHHHASRWGYTVERYLVQRSGLAAHHRRGRQRHGEQCYWVHRKVSSLGYAIIGGRNGDGTRGGNKRCRDGEHWR